MIRINDAISISERELVFKFSRSSGPGGQNVNKVNTRVTLLFDISRCEALSQTQKNRILRCLGGRVAQNGVLRVVAQADRTQKANRSAALEKLVELLQNALKTRPVRKKTKIPQAVREKRLERKKQRGLLKKQRAKVEIPPPRFGIEA